MPENPFLFTGREWDSELGLSYYRARYYRPSLGRFISRDPVFADRYRYVGNNPLNAVDPWGLFPPLVASMSLPPLDSGRGGRIDGPGATPPLERPAPGDRAPDPEPEILIDIVPEGPGIIITDGPIPGGGGIEFGGGKPGILDGEGPAGGQCLLVDRAESGNSEKPKKDEGPPPYPQNPDESPGPGWEKRGPNWYNPETGQSLYPDLDNTKHGPHYDWRDSAGRWWRYYPDGRLEQK